MSSLLYVIANNNKKEISAIQKKKKKKKTRAKYENKPLQSKFCIHSRNLMFESLNGILSFVCKGETDRCIHKGGLEDMLYIGRVT